MVDAAQQGPQLSADSGPLQPGVGVGQVPGQRQQGPGDRVRGDQGHITPGAGQPLGHPDPDRTTHRVMDDHRPVGQRAGAVDQQGRRLDDQARPVHWDAQGCGPGPGGQDHLLAAGAGGVECRGGDLGAGLHGHPEHSALGDQPFGQRGQAVAPRSHRRCPQRPAEPIGPLHHPYLVTAGGQHPGALEAGHPGADDHYAALNRIGPVHRGLDGLVPATRLSHAADHRVAIVADPAGLIAQDAGTGPIGGAGPHQ